MSIFALCAILGALIGLSFKTQNQILKHTDLPARNYQGLAQDYIMLEKTEHNDEQTIADLRSSVASLEDGQSGTNYTRALVDQLEQAQFLAGLTSVTGPGLIVTLDDSKKAVPVIAGMTPPNLIHDTDIDQTINELKAAGAEAVSVNAQRIVSTTPIRCAGPTIWINNTPQTPPYVIKAIGDPKTLLSAINLPNGVAAQFRSFDPAMIALQPANQMTIPAFTGAMQPKYAKPAPPDADSGNSSS